MLRSAVEHYERQASLAVAALTAARRKPWRDSARIAEIVALFQLAAAQDALDSIDPMLAEQDLQAPAVAAIAASSFAGLASDGRSLISLLEQAASPVALGLMVVTQVQDMARTAAGVSIASRPSVGYVRMLNPPSCSRCVILAGRFYRYNEGFLRHPECDCRHIPSAESISGDLTVDPQAYFESLDPAGRLKLAGSQANLRAIEDGADLNQIVNAYRKKSGMSEAGIRKVADRRGGFSKVTDEGTARRGRFATQQRGLRLSGQTRRLMPETIYRNAPDQASVIRQLKFHGWIKDDEAIARGLAIYARENRGTRAEAQRLRRARIRAEREAAAS